MENFTYSIPTKVIFGKGAMESLADCVLKYGSRVLIVYGGGSIKRSGLFDQITGLLEKAGISYCELGGVEPNPRLRTAMRGIELCRREGIEVVLPVGGGSTIDCAKMIAAGYFYEGNPWDLVDGTAEVGEVLPIITISTISATGSEMDPFAVITNEETKEKRDLEGENLYPVYSILDPQHTFTVSAYQTACGTADIMSHIFEVYFSKVEETYMQDRIMEALLATCIRYGPIACAEPDNYDARANLMWASEWAINGMIACGKPGPWPAHSIEHQLSAYYDITHGHGLAIMTPVLMEYILNETSLPRFVNYGVNVWKLDAALDDMTIAREAIARTKELYRAMGLSDTLKECGVPDRSCFAKMAETAAAEDLSECLMPLDAKDVIAIYEKCYE